MPSLSLQVTSPVHRIHGLLFSPEINNSILQINHLTFPICLSTAIWTGSQRKEENTTEVFQMSTAEGEPSVWFPNWNADEKQQMTEKLEEFGFYLLNNVGKARID